MPRNYRGNGPAEGAAVCHDKNCHLSVVGRFAVTQLPIPESRRSAVPPFTSHSNCGSHCLCASSISSTISRVSCSDSTAEVSGSSMIAW